MNLPIETEQEDDGRWIAEITTLSGVLVYGQTREEAITRVEALALRVLADRLDIFGAAADFPDRAFSEAAVVQAIGDLGRPPPSDRAPKRKVVVLKQKDAHLAIALQQKGDKTRALEQLKEALKYNPPKEEKDKIQQMIGRLG